MQDMDGLLASLHVKGVKLWCESGRLHYRAPKGVLQKDELLAIREQREQIVALLMNSQTMAEALQRLGPRRSTDPVPLAFLQEPMWNEREGQQFSNNLLTYSLKVSGPLNVEALCLSFEEIARRHESLRTRFITIDGEPRQVVGDASEYRLRIVNFEGNDRRDVEAYRHVERFFSQWLNLETDPLFQAFLLKLSDLEHVLAVAIHHIVSDAASTAILFRELWALYEGYIRGKKASLPDVCLQYADYAVWLRRTESYWRERQELYWKARLFGATRIRWPVEENLEPAVANSATTFEISFDELLSSGIHTLARQLRVTPAVVMLAAYAAVVSHYCSQKDFVIPIIVSGRNFPSLDYMMGNFVQVLFLRVELTGDESFRDLLETVQHEFLMAWKHMESGIIFKSLPQTGDLVRASIVEWLPWEPAELDGTRVPLGMNYTDIPLKVESFPVKAISNSDEKSPFDIVMYFYDDARKICGYGYYRRDIFSARTMQRLIEDLQRVAGQMVRNPRCPVASMWIGNRGDNSAS